MGTWAGIEKQVEESVTYVQEHWVPAERGSIIKMNAESTLKTKYKIHEFPCWGTMTLHIIAIPFHNCVEIKIKQMRTRKFIFFKACYSKGVSHHHLCLETQRKQKSGEAL